MRPSSLFGAIALVYVAGCGTAVRPHVTVGGADRPPGMAPGGRLNPRPTPEIGTANEGPAVIDEVCRVEAMRAGWIAIRYIEAAERCPEPTDSQNRYTGAVIERYSHKPVGSTMVVCADQPVPRQWMRERHHDERLTCQGARVNDGAPTVMVIRRVSSGS